jgi:hypothetical protein
MGMLFDGFCFRSDVIDFESLVSLGTIAAKQGRLNKKTLHP